MEPPTFMYQAPMPQLSPTSAPEKDTDLVWYIRENSIVPMAPGMCIDTMEPHGAL